MRATISTAAGSAAADDTEDLGRALTRIAPDGCAPAKARGMAAELAMSQDAMSPRSNRKARNAAGVAVRAAGEAARVVRKGKRFASQVERFESNMERLASNGERLMSEAGKACVRGGKACM